MASAEEQTVYNEVMELLEAGPDSSTSSEFLQPFTGADDTPAKREKLAVLVSTGKSKEAIGIQLTHSHLSLARRCVGVSTRGSLSRNRSIPRSSTAIQVAYLMTC